MSRLPTSVALGLLGLLTGCTATLSTPARDNTAAMRAEFETITAAFHEALGADNTETMMTYVADDVLLAPPGEPLVRGKEAMRAWHAGFLTQYRTTSLTLSDKEVFVGEGWAVEFGSFEWGLAPAAGGDTMVDRGSYMQVWRRTPEGKWQFTREIWNSSAPPVP